MKFDFRHNYLILLCFTFLFWSCRHADHEVYRLIKSAGSDKGMVVSAHPLASEVGLRILKSGGNAADACIAVQLALAVVYPRAGNIGGGGFLVYRNQQGQVQTLDYREKAPLTAYRDMFIDSSGNIIENLSTEGILAAGVPGTIAGLVEIHRKLGKLQPWSRLVEPAIELAEKGFLITKIEADRLNKYKSDFQKYNAVEIPFIKNEIWKPGEIIVQKTLAKTLRFIAEQGHDGFYAGSNMESIVALSKEKMGLITANDLKSYQAIWRSPLVIPWRDYTIYSMPLPSSGGVIIGQILGMLNQHLVDSLGYRSVQNVHLLVEAERRAFTDRAQFLGDQDFYNVPVDSLLNPNYLQKKMSDFNPDRATDSKQITNGTFKMQRESFETTHISVVDQDGNAASATTTLNTNYGCKVWVPGGGYFLNSEMDDFSALPGAPNFYGLIGGEANAIAPGKRMLSSMSPSIVERNGSLWMVLGTPGGSTIMTSVVQVFLNVAAYGMTIDEAVQSPRFHHQWLPNEIMMEPDAFSPTLSRQLEDLGHNFKPVDYIGAIEAIMVGHEGRLRGAADRRGDDHAAGW